VKGVNEDLFIVSAAQPSTNYANAVTIDGNEMKTKMANKKETEPKD